MTLTLKEAKRRYPQEWLAFKVEKEGSSIDTMRGQVLEHDKDRREIHRRLREKKIKEVYLTFAGPLIRPGYEVMFRCGSV
ncbi:MAG: hypothetical protein HYZ50_20785 [Deltaproteobacteria bacterium]|nr:hypothetical protein [Deltaproteobacteria bacterium]